MSFGGPGLTSKEVGASSAEGRALGIFLLLVVFFHLGRQRRNETYLSSAFILGGSMACA